MIKLEGDIFWIKIVAVFVLMAIVALIAVVFIVWTNGNQAANKSIDESEKTENEEKSKCWESFKENKCTLENLNTTICKALHKCVQEHHE